MIVNTPSDVRTNLTGSVEFSVSEDSAKIFKFLSNFLYKDKERSVMTELCSNAIDAHKMVGKDNIPIKVWLPTSLQKEFRVRDYGPGLTEEQVYHFLTKYGSSSKTSSNDFIGGFGIGSKSPAAVTDTWTINSYNQGFETSYLVYVNELGIPCINKLFSRPTNETGLEVIVPTKTINEWHDAAHKVFEFYKIKPEIKGSNLQLKETNFIYVLNDLVLLLENPRTYYSKCFTIINNRAYEVDLVKLGLKSFFKHDFYLPFNTGELSVSLSREDLQYDKRTIDAIKKRFSDIKEVLVENWKKNVSSINYDVFEYQFSVKKFKENNQLESKICEEIAFGENDKFASVINFDYLDRFFINFTEDDLRVQYIDKTSGVCTTLTNNRRIIGNNSVSIRKSKVKTISFICKNRNDIVFVLRDTINTPSRVKLAIDKGILSSAIILDKLWFDMVPNFFNKILASTLEYKKIEHKKIEKVNSELFIKSGRHFVTIKEDKIDKTKEWVYIRMSNANTVSSIIDETDSKFVSSFEKDGPNFIFLKSSTKAPTWAISRNEWLNKEYNKFSSKINEMIKAKQFEAIKSFYHLSFFGRYIHNPNDYDIPKNTIADEILTSITTILKSNVDLTILNYFDTFKKCSIYLNKLEVINKIDYESNYLSRMIDAYPMFKFINNAFIYEDDMKCVIEYIKSCGK